VVRSGRSASQNGHFRNGPVMAQTRRSFLRNSGIGLLTFYVGGCEVEMTPQEARESEIPFGVLSDAEVKTIDALGEILLPGAASAGLAHFIDHQLGAASDDQLLMIKYLGVPPPFASFYQGGLAAVNALSQSQKGKPFAELNQAEQTELLGQFAQGNPDEWEGPPGPFFYFVLRNDAVDVVYGTREGIESLGIPYMAHIEPPSRWGE
jgi:hypothetical protein